MTVALALRDYQEEALERIRNAEARGVRRQLGVAATGLGKQQPLDEPVLTSDGWSTMGDLTPGDLVIGGDGKPVEVLSVHPQGVQPVVRVSFADGAWTRCGPEHLWATRSKSEVHRGRPWRVVEATELRPGDHVPVVEPVHHTIVPLPVDPYQLGVLLGDGSIGTGNGHALTVSTDRWIAERCGWHGLRPHKTSPYTVEGTARQDGLRPALKSLGLWGCRSWEKHLPPLYLLGTPADRLALLRGLMDTDGSPMDSGGAEFSSTSEALVLAVADLARSLGGVARNITSRVTTYTYRGERRTGRRSWRVNVKLPADTCPFLLPRKAEAWVPPSKYPPARIIRSVEADGPPVEQACIRVANPDGLYVTRHHIVTHNTVMFCALAEQRGHRALILAHRDELISQAAAKVREVWPGVDVGIVKGSRDEVHAHVVVASVQTLARPARLARLTAAWGPNAGVLTRTDPFGLVVCDEAHHARAETYGRILDAVNAGASDGPLLLGVTATPDRGDGLGLDDVFDEVVFNYDILYGIRSGYLSDLRGLAVRIDTLDMAGVKVSRGDYEVGAAGRALEASGAPAKIVEAWRQHAGHRRTLVFTPTVATAEHIAAEFVAIGVSAAFVSGDTPLEQRRDLLRRFGTGEIQVLANCAVLTEGYDEPAVDCVIIARPTRSRALYVQMVGRGTRRHPDKTDCLVVDVVGAAAEHSLVTVPSLFGLDGAHGNRMGNGTARLAETLEAHQAELVAAGRVSAEEADLFRRVRAEGIAWVPIHKPGDELRRYQRSLGQRATTVVLVQKTPEPDSWLAGIQLPDGSKRVLISGTTLELAQGVGEDYVRRRTPGGLALVSADAPWRTGKPSRKALAAAKRWNLPIDSRWTAGELSDALDAHIARIRAKQPARRTGS